MEKNYQKSRPKIMSADVDQLQRKPVKSSEASRDLNGYLEPLTHMRTVLNSGAPSRAKRAWDRAPYL